MNGILAAGRTIRASSRAIACQGRFLVERCMTFYDFDQIDRAARDAEAGEVIKPVLRTGGS